MSRATRTRDHARVNRELTNEEKVARHKQSILNGRFPLLNGENKLQCPFCPPTTFPTRKLFWDKLFAHAVDLGSISAYGEVSMHQHMALEQHMTEVNNEN